MRVFWAILSISFSLFLYGLFGVLCAVGYKAVQDESYDPILETSPKLYNFFLDKKVASELFSLDEIQYGVVDLMFKQASKNAKVGEPIVLTAVPAILFEDNKALVVVPVAFNSVLGVFYTGVIFHFDISKEPTLRDVKIGGAKLPRFASDFITGVLEERYEESFGEFFEKFDSLRVTREGDKFRLTKK